jgi:uncharacterized membrane protein HdeD (DUF308 family)
MASLVAKNWWALALRGIVAIGFGILAILVPGLTVVALVVLFAAYSFVDGVLAISSGIRRDSLRGRNRTLIMGGVCSIGAAVVTLLWPNITALVLLALIALWAIVIGAIEIIAAYRLRREIRGEWALALDGLLSLVFGLFILFFPGAGAIALLWLIGAYAIVSGVLLVMLAFRLRAYHTDGARSRLQATRQSPAH